ncbi:hypothetical protein [Streptomyces sp. BRA346]
MRHQDSRLRASVGVVVLAVLALLVPAAASGRAVAAGGRTSPAGAVC